MTEIKLKLKEDQITFLHECKNSVLKTKVVWFVLL